MTRLIIFLFCLFLFFECKKQEPGGDLSGNGYIRGRLFLDDPLGTQLQQTALAKKTITIAYAASTDTLNYLFTDTTDADGYFVFRNLKENTAYRLYYEESIGGVVYSALHRQTASSDTVRMTATISRKLQNGLFLTVKDSTGGGIARANVYLFTSQLPGYLKGTGEGSNYQLITDANGHVIKLGLDQQNYYVLATATFNGQNWKANNSLAVSDTLVIDTLVLKPVVPELSNGFKFVTFDSAGGRMPGVNICLFTSAALFVRDTCAGSNYQLVSDSNGVAVRSSLPQGTYYVYSTLAIKQSHWVTKDTLVLKDQLITDSLYLKSK